MAMLEIAPENFALWNRAVKEYATTTTEKYRDLAAMADIAYRAFAVFDSLRLPNSYQRRELLITAQNYGSKYNALGRVIDGVNSGKYVLSNSTLFDNDLAVFAKPGSSTESYQDDRLGLGVVWWAPIIVGVVLIGGVYALLKSLNLYADTAKTDLALELVRGDIDALNSPDPQAKKTWEKWKNDNQKQIETANSIGLLDRLLGSGSGNAAILVLGALGALAIWTKARG